MNPELLLRLTVWLATGWLVLLVIPKRNPRWSVVTTRLVAVGCLLLPLAHAWRPPIELAVLPPALLPAAEVETAAAPTPIAKPSAVVTSDSAPGSAGGPTPQKSVAPDSIPRQSRGLNDESEAEPLAPLQKPSTSPAVPWRLIAAWLWSAGVVVLLARLSVLVWRTRALVKRSDETPNTTAQECVQLAEEFGLPSPKSVVQSDEVACPCTTGWPSPSLLLPRGWDNELTEEERRAVLVHELTHLAGRDSAWDLVARLATSLWWFHPLVWRLATAHRLACEFRCDAVAAGSTGDTPAYRRMLAAWTLRGGRSAAAPGVLAMASTSALVRRVRRLERAITSTKIGRGVFALTAGVAALLVVIIASLQLTSRAVAEEAAGDDAPPATADPAKGQGGQPLIERPDVADIDYARRTPKRVRIVGPDDKPLADATFHVVWWRDDQGDYDFNTSGRLDAEEDQTSDESGELTLSVPAGAARVSFRAEAPGFAAASDELSLSGEPVVKLQPGRLVQVWARDEAGEPLADAVPLLEDCRRFPKEFKADPGQPGLFNSPVIGPGRRWMRVVAADKEKRLLFSDLIDLMIPTPGAPVATLRPGVRLTGRLDDAVPRPVKMGCVELYVQEGEGGRLINNPKLNKITGNGWTWRDTARIQEDGTFEFPSVPPAGHVQLFALVDGFHTRRPSGAELRDYLTDNNLGDPELVDTALGRDFLPLFFPMPAGQDTVEVTLPCVAAAGADIRVVDPGGQPIEGAAVNFNPNLFFLGHDQVLPGIDQFTDAKRVLGGAFGFYKPGTVADWASKSIYSIPTGPDGIARVRNLPAGRVQGCRVEAEGYVVPSDPGSTPDFDQRYALIEPQSDKIIRRTITMERLIARAPRDVAVVDADGKPLAGLKVTGAEIAFADSPEDWQFWSVQRFGAIPSGETNEGGQVRLNLPTEIANQRVAALRVIVVGRISHPGGRDAYVQRKRVAIPPADDGGVIVVTESTEEPARRNAFYQTTLAYRPLAEVGQKPPLELLTELEKKPTLTTLKRLLAAAGFDEATPLEFRTERNSLTAYNDNPPPTPVSRVTLDDNRERVVAMCRVRPKGAAWTVKPRLRFAPEAAFVFDGVDGSLVTMLGGWASSRGSYCDVYLTDLNTPGDYFVQASASEDNGPFKNITRWTRLGNESRSALTTHSYYATGHSAGSHMGSLKSEFGYTHYNFRNRNLDDRLPGLQASGEPAPRKIYWDGRLNKFVGPPEMECEGKPLYRIVTEESGAFQAFEPKFDQLFVAGGRRSYRNWHWWDVMVPGTKPAKFRVFLARGEDQEQPLDPNLILEWDVPPGLNLVQLHAKPKAKAGQPDIEVWINEKVRDKKRLGVPAIDFAAHRSAPGEPVVRTAEKSITLARYPTAEEGVWLSAVLTLEP